MTRQGPGGAGGDGLRYDTTQWDVRSSHGFIVALVGTGKRVLDVGCATGGLLEALKERGNEGLGLEGDAPQARAAAARGLAVTEWDLRRGLPPLEGQTFDVVIFADVLEHVADPAPLLQGARSHLAPGGRLLISVPNVAHLSVRLRLLAGRFEYRDHGIMDQTHLRFFTRHSASRLLEGCGYQVLRQMAVPAIPAPPGLERLAIGRAWVGSRAWRRLEEFLTELVPGLFAYQFVLEAAPLGASETAEARRAGA